MVMWYMSLVWVINVAYQWWPLQSNWHNNKDDGESLLWSWFLLVVYFIKNKLTTRSKILWWVINLFLISLSWNLPYFLYDFYNLWQYQIIKLNLNTISEAIWVQDGIIKLDIYYLTFSKYHSRRKVGPPPWEIFIVPCVACRGGLL